MNGLLKSRNRCCMDCLGEIHIRILPSFICMMVLYTVLSANVAIQYKNNILSKASFFLLVTTFIAILFPLILAYRSRGFWLKNHTFIEQPDVRFKYQYFFIAETDDVDHIISCGNLPNIFHLLHNEEECFYTQVQEKDYNADNKIDEILFTLHISNPAVKNIYSVKGLLIMDYKLNRNCPLDMEILVNVNQAFGLPTTKYFLTSNLQVVQPAPLPCIYNYKDVRYNHSVIPKYDELITDRNWYEDILYKYSRRNVSASLTNVYTSSIHGTTPKFEVLISVGIPEHTIRYKPGFWQELKHAWLQYFSIAVIFFWVLIKIKVYVFENRILPAWKTVPWKKDL